MAWLQDEDGAPVVVEAIGAGATISVVNWAEVLSKVAEAGKEPETLIAELADLGVDDRTLPIAPITNGDCIEMARLRPVTKPQGLSLADRACLALAARLGVPPGPVGRQRR